MVAKWAKWGPFLNALELVGGRTADRTTAVQAAGSQGKFADSREMREVFDERVRSASGMISGPARSDISQAGAAGISKAS